MHSCSFRPFLDNLRKMEQNGQLRRNSKLQLISTDTWDISDDLSNYTDIADILQVIFLMFSGIVLHPPYTHLELHHYRGGCLRGVGGSDETTSGKSQTEKGNPGEESLVWWTVGETIAQEPYPDRFQDRLQGWERDERSRPLQRDIQKVQEDNLSSTEFELPSFKV